MPSDFASFVSHWIFCCLPGDDFDLRLSRHIDEQEKLQNALEAMEQTVAKLEAEDLPSHTEQIDSHIGIQSYKSQNNMQCFGHKEICLQAHRVVNVHVISTAIAFGCTFLVFALFSHFVRPMEKPNWRVSNKFKMCREMVPCLPGK